MAATALTATTSTVQGIVPTLVAANVDGNYFANTGAEILIVKNGSASPCTVTIARTKSCDMGTAHTIATIVAAGTEAIFGCFRKDWFDDANQRVQITYSVVTTITVGVLKIATSGL